MDRVWAKLTWVGDQTKGIRTLVFHTPGHPVAMSDFVPFRKPSVRYFNDYDPPQEVDVSPRQMQALIREIGRSRDLWKRSDDSNGFLAFTMLHSGEHRNEVFETVVNENTEGNLYAALQASLKSNSAALSALEVRGYVPRRGAH